MSDSPLSAADQLFAAFPAWRQFARYEKADDDSTYVVVEIPAPVEAHVEHGLVIDTSNDEITVGFDCYHTHFNEWVGDGAHFGTEVALEFVRQILAERVAVVSWWFNERWCGSAQMEAGAAHETPSWANPSSCNRIRIRSWHGTLNADIST